MTTPKIGRFTNISHHPFSPFLIRTANCQLNVYLLKLFLESIQSKCLTHKWTSSLYSSVFYLENFNAGVAIMMKKRVTKAGGVKQVTSDLWICLLSNCCFTSQLASPNKGDFSALDRWPWRYIIFAVTFIIEYLSKITSYISECLFFKTPSNILEVVLWI